MATEAAKIYNNLYIYKCFLVNNNKILSEQVQKAKIIKLLSTLRLWFELGRPYIEYIECFIV